MKPEDIIGSDPLSWYFPYVIAVLVGVITCIRSYIAGQDCPSRNRIDGKIVLITGGSGNIAVESAKELAKRGARIILACRDIEKGNVSRQLIQKECPGSDVILKKLNICSMSSVRHFAQMQLSEFRKIDVLINNASIIDNQYELTEDGYELHMATNYFGHFLLIHTLIPKLKAAGKARIVNVTCDVHKNASLNLNDICFTTDWSANAAFARSKLCLVLMAKHMSKLLNGITINAVSPGRIRGKHSSLACFTPTITLYKWLFLKDARQGAQGIIHAVVDVTLEKISGRYLSNCELQEFCNEAKGNRLSADLYERTCALLQIERIKD